MKLEYYCILGCVVLVTYATTVMVASYDWLIADRAVEPPWYCDTTDIKGSRNQAAAYARRAELCHDYIARKKGYGDDDDKKIPE